MLTVIAALVRVPLMPRIGLALSGVGLLLLASCAQLPAPEPAEASAEAEPAAEPAIETESGVESESSAAVEPGVAPESVTESSAEVNSSVATEPSAEVEPDLDTGAVASAVINPEAPLARTESNATAIQTIEPSELDLSALETPTSDAMVEALLLEERSRLAAAEQSVAAEANASDNSFVLPNGNTVDIDNLEDAFAPESLVPEEDANSYPITIKAREREYLFFVDEYRLRTGKPIFDAPKVQASTLQIPDIDKRRRELYATHQSPLHVDERLNIWGQFFGQLRLSDRYSSYKRVRYYRDWWLEDLDDLSDFLASAELYMFYVYEEVKRRGLPAEIALLPFIESRFDPYAYSHASAAGLWQITQGTGKYLGLESNWWRQERRDIRLSTNAALDYLEELNAEYKGDWLLSLAAYNAGPGRVNGAIRRAGGKRNYWNLRLPQETRDYVPKLLALAQIVANPQLYQFQPPFIASVPTFTAAKTGKQIELAQAARLLGIDVSALFALNPQLNQLATDFTVTDTEILVPFELGQRLESLLARQDPSERNMWLSYKRQKNETLTAVSKRFGSYLQNIAQVNNLREQSRYLLIPINGDDYQRYAGLHSAPKPDELITRDIVHRVKSGDSLWKIARAYDVSIGQIELWNNISRNNYLKLNSQLIIRKKTPSNRSAYALHDYYEHEVIRPVSYRVRRGDSLARIAAKYGVGIAQIRDWNSSVSGSFIRPGQYLRLYLDITKLL